MRRINVIYLTAACLSIILTLSCGNGSTGSQPNQPSSQKGASPLLKEEEKILFDKVMALHDSAMAQMGHLTSMTSAMRKISTNTTLSRDKTDVAKHALESLSLADKHMWDWMYQFKKKNKWKNEKGESYQAYLSEQIKMITKVSNEMNSAIESAKRVAEH